MKNQETIAAYQHDIKLLEENIARREAVMLLSQDSKVDELYNKRNERNRKEIEEYKKLVEKLKKEDAKIWKSLLHGIHLREWWEENGFIIQYFVVGFVLSIAVGLLIYNLLIWISKLITG